MLLLFLYHFLERAVVALVLLALGVIATIFAAQTMKNRVMLLFIVVVIWLYCFTATATQVIVVINKLWSLEISCGFCSYCVNEVMANEFVIIVELSQYSGVC